MWTMRQYTNVWNTISIGILAHYFLFIPQRPGRFAEDCFSSLPAYGQQGYHTQ